MIRIGTIGLGKMGISHHALLHAHPEVEAIACDTSKYVLGVLQKNTGITAYGDYSAMLADGDLDAVVVATPSAGHLEIARAAINRGLHVFCEKPLTLTARDSEELALLAEQRGVVTQTGYHNRYVGSFQTVKALLDAGAIGTVTHILGEAYGPVVLKPKGSTWRSRRSDGGGCLYDYAAHVINLINWYFGLPGRVGGTVLPKVFSSDTDDAAFSTFVFPDGKTGQLSVYWSDESFRKMTTRVNIWGTDGRIFADRQECQVYFRDSARIPPGFEQGWNVKYTTDMTQPVWFYLRGEEYSAQIAAFVSKIIDGQPGGRNDFASAALTDRTIDMMLADFRGNSSVNMDLEAPGEPSSVHTPFLRRRRWRRHG